MIMRWILLLVMAAALLSCEKENVEPLKKGEPTQQDSTFFYIEFPDFGDTIIVIENEH